MIDFGLVTFPIKISAKNGEPLVLTKNVPVARLVAFTLLAFSSLHSITAGAQQYSMSDLGTLGGTYSGGYGINSAGQVVGASYTAKDALLRPFLYGNAGMIDLGTLGGIVGYGYGVNHAGHVTGLSDTRNGQHAFLYSNGSMVDLGTLGGSDSAGYGINTAGQITGFSSTANNGAQHAFLYSYGSMSDLGTLGGADSYGYSINDIGQIVGTAADKYGTYHAFLYRNGSMTDIGSLGGGYGEANGINSGGQITGISLTAGHALHAFLYSNGAMKDLGTLGGARSAGLGINRGGQVVGYSLTANNAQRAFVYSKSIMKDLNSLIEPGGPLAKYVTLTDAMAINDNGWIVADGIDSRTGDTNAYLLQAVSPAAQLAALLTEVKGVGPGQSLANKVALAQDYYAVSDIPATCTVLAGFVSEVRAQSGKKISPQLDAKLIANAQLGEAEIGCKQANYASR
jgi:probable HAF family extracellular repeat protein